MSKRDEIIEAADQLFYQQGFEHTSFAHIAESVKISRGNFYYHFKTKDEILDAVIALRMSRTQAMLDKWEMKGELPIERIRSFIDILLVNKHKIKRFGCPVGTLTTELNKLKHPGQADANRLFTLFRVWLKRQFEQMGGIENADELAMHLLARSQGVAMLANAFNDEAFIHHEVLQLNEWLSQYSGNTA
ncbi:MAG: TetR/AcrR family transcriptional regulator [Arenicella sp.]